MKIGNLSREIRKSYRKSHNWRKTAAEFGLSSGMAYRIAKNGYEPKDAHIRHKLGLPALMPAPVCHNCGEVHVSHRCPYKRKYKRLFDMPTKMLRKMLDERA